MKQIAYELNISKKTVGEYWDRIRNKLNISTNPELIHFVLAHDLVPNLFAPKPDGTISDNVLPLNLANQKRA